MPRQSRPPRSEPRVAEARSGPAATGSGAPDGLDWAARVQRLEGEVAGLRRAMRTRGLIEQAKGMLAERFSCDPEEAFGYLSRLSQDANVRLVDIAADVIGSPRPGTAEPDQETVPAGGPSPFEVAFEPPPVATHTPGRPAPDAAPAASALPPDLSRRFRRTSSAAQAAETMAELTEALLRDGLSGLHASAVVVYGRETDGALRLLGASGWPAQAVSDWQRIPSGVKTGIGHVVRLGRPLWYDVAEHEDFLAVGPGHGRAVFPVRILDRVVGALAFIWPEPHPVDEKEQRYLSALAGVGEREAARLWTGGQAPGPLAEGRQWLQGVLDSVFGPAQLLSPVRDGAGTVVDFVIDYANPAAAEAARRPLPELVGRRLLDLYPSLLTSGVFEQYQRVLADGVPQHSDAVPETALQDGRMRQRVVSRRAARLGDGLVVTWQRLDGELRREHQLTQMEALGQFGWLDWNLGTGETYWSPGMYRVFGRDPARGPASLDTLPSVVLAEDLPSAESLVRRVLEQGREASAEFRVRRDGQVRHLRLVVEPRLDARGHTTGVAALAQDISEERHADEKVRRVEQQLAEQRIRLAAQQSLTRRMREVLYPASELSFEAPGVRIAGRHLLPVSAGDVRGDFCDATVLPDGDVLLMIGDIFGSGVQAAAVMSRLLYPIRAMGLGGTPPAEILALLNAELRRDPEPPLASVLVARYDHTAGVLHWAQAGHLPPAVLTAGQARLAERPVGVALGLLPEPRYTESRLALHPGDIVALYTDGVVYGRTDADGGGETNGKPVDPLSALLTRLRHAARRGGLTGVLDACLRPREDEACLLAMQAVASRAPIGGRGVEPDSGPDDEPDEDEPDGADPDGSAG